MDVKNVLKKGSKIKSSNLKILLLKEGYKENRCEVCGISKWQNKKLVCQLHHIDGDSTNNTLENLQILCPNCHSQTETYCSSSKGNHKKNYCLVCGKEISKKSTYCPECFHYLQRKVNRPSKDDLINDFNNLKSFLQVGRKYNVSDNAVRKWCKQYNYWPGHIKTLIRQ